MNEQEEFLSPEHNKLLNVAIWAKYLAWVVLVIYIALAGLIVIQKQITYYQMQRAVSSSAATPQDYWGMVSDKPAYYLIDTGLDMIITFLRGIIFYVILKGISLGLYMIVETDINYREKGNQGSAE